MYLYSVQPLHGPFFHTVYIPTYIPHYPPYLYHKLLGDRTKGEAETQAGIAIIGPCPVP